MAESQHDDGDQEEIVEVPAASYRLIMVTVCLSNKVSSNQEAYQNLVNAIINFQKSLKSTDFVCYNIGSPLLSASLQTDCQKNMPDFNTVFAQHQNFNEEVRDRSSTYNGIKSAKDLNVGNLIKTNS